MWLVGEPGPAMAERGEEVVWVVCEPVYVVARVVTGSPWVPGVDYLKAWRVRARDGGVSQDGPRYVVEG